MILVALFLMDTLYTWQHTSLVSPKHYFFFSYFLCLSYFPFFFCFPCYLCIACFPSVPCFFSSLFHLASYVLSVSPVSPVSHAFAVSSIFPFFPVSLVYSVYLISSVSPAYSVFQNTFCFTNFLLQILLWRKPGCTYDNCSKCKWYVCIVSVHETSNVI